jgi:hypothetical protein
MIKILFQEGRLCQRNGILSSIMKPVLNVGLVSKNAHTESMRRTPQHQRLFSRTAVSTAATAAKAYVQPIRYNISAIPEKMLAAAVSAIVSQE